MRERLIVIVDCAAASAVEGVLGGVPAGTVLVQLRDKLADDETLQMAAERLRRVTRTRGARFVINGKIQLATEVGADGVHLPEAANSATGGSIATGGTLVLARRALGKGALVGQSRHSIEGVLAAAAEGADYLTIGPVWATPGKGTPQGIEFVRDAAFELRSATDRRSAWDDRAAPRTAALGPRLFALGGIDSPDKAAECVRAGAHGVALIRAAGRAAELLAAMENA